MKYKKGKKNTTCSIYCNKDHYWTHKCDNITQNYEDRFDSSKIKTKLNILSLIFKEYIAVTDTSDAHP